MTDELDLTILDDDGNEVDATLLINGDRVGGGGDGDSNWTLNADGALEPAGSEPVSVDELRNIADHIVETAEDWNKLPETVSVGEVVWIGPGGISGAENWYMPNDCTLVGGGSDTTTVALADGHNTHLLEPGQNCTIRGVTFDANNENQTDFFSAISIKEDGVTFIDVDSVNSMTHNFSVRQCSNTRFVACTAENAGDDGFALGPGTDGANVLGCISRLHRGENSTMSSGYEIDDGAKNVTLVGNQSNGCLGSSVTVHDHADMDTGGHVTVSSHISRDDGSGIRISSDEQAIGTTRRLSISNVQIYNPNGVGLSIQASAEELSAENVLIVNPSGGHAVRSTTTGGHAEFNNIRGVAGPDTTADTARFMRIQDGEDFDISNCKSRGFARGYHIEGGKDVTVDNSKAYDASDYGFYSQSDPKMTNCTAINCDSGFVMNGSRTRLINPEVRGDMTNGIVVSAGEADPVINGGYIVSEGFNGIDIRTASNVRIEGIKILTENGDLTNGVRTGGGSVETRIINCEFEGAMNALNIDADDNAILRHNIDNGTWINEGESAT